MTSQPRRDGYVECGECGHPIEEHDQQGCEPCRDLAALNPCPEPWTAAQIRQVRLREGLPAAYH